MDKGYSNRQSEVLTLALLVTSAILIFVIGSMILSMVLNLELSRSVNVISAVSSSVLSVILIYAYFRVGSFQEAQAEIAKRQQEAMTDQTKILRNQAMLTETSTEPKLMIEQAEGVVFQISNLSNAPATQLKICLVLSEGAGGKTITECSPLLRRDQIQDLDSRKRVKLFQGEEPVKRSMHTIRNFETDVWFQFGTSILGEAYEEEKRKITGVWDTDQDSVSISVVLEYRDITATKREPYRLEIIEEQISKEVVDEEGPKSLLLDLLEERFPD